MRRTYLLFVLTFILSLGLAGCIPALAFPTPTATLFLPPTLTPTVTPSPTPTATPIPPTRVIAPPPAWVKEFADPILDAVLKVPPTFKDDFSGYNLGWFYTVRDSARGPYYAHLEEEALVLRIPEGREFKDSWVYNPYLRHADFVLTLDFKFYKTQPYDVLRFQFNQSADQNVQLDLSKHEQWFIDWSLRSPKQAVKGTYQTFSPEFNRVTILMRGQACAFYLNDDPLAYLSDCRTSAVVEKSSRAVSFHLLSTTGQDAEIVIDNVKIWDLSKVPGLP